MDTTLEIVKDAVLKELNCPGKLFGYRAMNQKLGTEHGIKVPRNLVQNVLYDLHYEGVACRCLENRTKQRNQPLTPKGSMWVVSVDGHDKICGYQNSTFPLSVYVFIDTFSRKIVSLKVMISNTDPRVIGKQYLIFSTH